MMGVKLWHVGDVIRKLREEHALTEAALARASGVSRRQIVDLENRGPNVERVTPLEWQTLDRVAAALGLSNGASLYKLIPPPGTASPRHRPASAGKPASRVLSFERRASRRER